MTPKTNYGQYLAKFPLRFFLIVPFVMQVFLAVGLVGYLSFRNGQKAVNRLVEHLSNEVSDRVDQHLDSYLGLPPQIGALGVDALQTGLIDIHNFRQAERFFWKQAHIYPNINFIGYYLNTGAGGGAGRWLPGQGVTVVQHSLVDGKDYAYATDAQGNRTKLLDATKYDARQDQWYQDGVKARKPVWSKIYTAEGFTGYVAATVAYPIYDKKRQLIGVFSTDLLLSEISNFLRQLQISPQGRVFIIERDGMLVGNSSVRETYNIVNGKTQRLSALNSPDPQIRMTAEHLKEKFGSFQAITSEKQLEFFWDDQRQFVQVLPWRDRYGLDWVVIVTIPESDFMGEINANTRTTILLCFAALMTTTLLGMLTSRWITSPIEHLSNASQAIAGGDLNQKVEVKSIRELNSLSQAFNGMAQQLRDWVDLLEKRVSERTVQLAEATKEAETAKSSAIAANRAKSEFLANMSHELRTPLNAILGFAQVMNRDRELKPEQQENLGIITRSGEHLLSLINDVLDMSKIEAGRIALNQNDFDLYAVLETIEEMLILRANLKGLSLIIDRAEDLPRYIKTDEKKLRQVLLNLLGNAIKFTQKGHIWLRVQTQYIASVDSPEKTYLKFIVEDTGPGIAPQDLESLFEPFVQTEIGRQSEQGTGLGLAISRKFVQLMGGDLKVSSQLGQGASFEFQIPLELSDLAHIPRHQKTRRVVGLVPDQPRYRILVVDDRWENRQVIVKLLRPIGFEVQEAANGQEALALWSSWEPHLIWMDMRMPVMNGFEATQQIKSHLQGHATIIIALTASALIEEIPSIRAVGCDDFVRKPFLEHEIFDKIGQFLGVKYIYETLVISEPEATPIEQLTKSALTVMPPKWWLYLSDAASELDRDKITQLIVEIPVEHLALRKDLQRKVDNFDFDLIMNMAQQIENL
ncbi:hybrid sensor histidine kinase/response regulator [Merismopedia glauca]|uniref:Circadian input-output histidine kinase CikA n=1 Tax=Merismopedia glauca CCAP 1448/3 TaxID=1296344 RepID=A0A2T1C3M9_9CYAN|nr:hybrid sensor histidine kinase/response regulator [Merismopedia glauca]PSB02723.1 hybrid sensor histidine kinase/response regulator [Merismopedia glauca CCAP 1448/3]